MQIVPPDRSVVGFEEIDPTQIGLVGGKGANLGTLSRLEGISVPAGFCVTTDAYRRAVAHAPMIDDRLSLLSLIDGDDRGSIRTISAEIRSFVEAIAIPDDVAAEITRAIARLGDATTYAVRSSATAEDLPTASFAGQQDSFLNVGGSAVLEHVSRCWASLFTERAVTYRLRNGIDQRKVQMAVIVQRMVVPVASGVLFTADPVTSNRRVVAIEATLGLGEALVSGRVDADVYRVRDGELVGKEIASKRLVTIALPTGGTEDRSIEPERQQQPALTDAQALRLAQLGRHIEAHFGGPQDIEWCLSDESRENDFQIVQSRPITTLFPIPVAGDAANHVYISVGHQQMMTDAMKPLGLSMWQMTALRPMFVAGGRLFVDVTLGLASPSSRSALLGMLERSDPLIRDAIETIVDRGDFVPPLPDGEADDQPAGAVLGGGAPAPIAADPAIVTGLVARSRESIAALERGIGAKSGEALFDFVLSDIPEMQRILSDPQSLPVIMAAVQATWWLNDQLHDWLGEHNAADTLTLSAPGNITSEMGLALLDVADVIRPHPAVVKLLREVDGDSFLDELPAVPGGRAAHDAISAYLDTYGMRCVGEIDITRPRWAEQPSTLVPVILANVASFEPGERERRVEGGRREAWAKEQELLERVRALPGGAQKADETKQMIDRVRTFIGYREYPKYGLVSRYFIYKRAVLGEADRLVRAGVLGDREDIFFLTFEELHDVVRTHRVDDDLIRRRKDDFRTFRSLTPPRVLTSDGEVVTGTYRRDDLPADALVGLAVSAGDVEGPARVILDMARADLAAGDILVTTATDPSWSPLFVQASGLVTEVGGLMTHGAVIAREYGLPAVVGVENATQVIRDGQRIRVNGTHGYVELLSEPSPAAELAG